MTPTPVGGTEAMPRAMEGANAVLPASLQRRLAQLYPFAQVADQSLDQLLALGVAALEDAIEGTGERRGAFELLMADACLTEACARALQDEDPGAALAKILEAIGEVDPE